MTEETRPQLTAEQFMKTVTPEGLFNYYQGLNRRERRRIDKTASKMKKDNQKIDALREVREKKKLLEEGHLLASEVFDKIEPDDISN